MTEVTTSPNRRAMVAEGLAYGVVVVFAVVFVARQSIRVGGSRVFLLFEDAMISMRYAHNLAHGHGLVWNVGAKPTEGFTDPLWTLWMAAIHAVGLGERAAPLVVSICAGLLVLATVAVAGRLAGRLAPGEPAARPVAMWLVALCFPLLFWSLLGTEVALVSFLILFAADQVCAWETTREPRRLLLASGAMVLGVLTRQDTVIAAAVLVAYVAFRSTGRSRWRSVGLLAGPVVASLVALTAFRLVVFGRVFPNTYYLKIAHIALRSRLRRGLDDLVTAGIAGLYLPLVLAGSYFLIRRRRSEPVAVLLIVMFGAQCAYAIWAGGDTYDNVAGPGRFVVVTLPALLIVASLGIVALRRKARTVVKAWLVAAAALVVAAGLRVGDVRPIAGGRFGALHADPLSWRIAGPVAALGVLAVLAAAASTRTRAHWVGPAALVAGVGLTVVSFAGYDLVGWANRGLTDANLTLGFDQSQARLAFGIRDATTSRAVLATAAVGQIGYFTGRDVVDLLGFTDTHVANEAPRSSRLLPGHNKWDLQYSLSRFHPDLVFESWPAVDDSDRSTIQAMGYIEIAPDVYMLRGTRRVDVPRVIELLARR